MTSEDVAAGAAVVVVAFAGSVVLGRPGLVVVERPGGAVDAVGDEDVGPWGTVDVVVLLTPHDVATSATPAASAQRRSREECA
jgi:hypothetical protein